MTIGRTRVAAPAALALALLAGCGTPGAPQPPSLKLPRPVEDLRAARQGDRVTLTWTPPRETTDKQRIRRPGVTRVCRSISNDPHLLFAEKAAGPIAQPECQQILAEVLPASLAPAAGAGDRRSAQATFVDTLPAELQQQHPLGSAVYALEVLNESRRSAGLSNAGAVPLAPTWPPPDRVSAQVTPDAVVLTWIGRPEVRGPPAGGSDRAPRIGEDRYRVLRREVGGQGKRVGAEVAVGEAPVTAATPYSFADRNFEWEKTYEYRVATETLVLAPGAPAPIAVEGAASPPVTVAAHDVFPPAAPTGVQAVFGALGTQGFIDLTWRPAMEPDLAGYNVFRREEGGAAVKISGELLKAPAFRDTSVAAGNTYWYSVSAVDLRGNQSARSAEASETAPAQP